MVGSITRFLHSLRYNVRFYTSDALAQSFKLILLVVHLVVLSIEVHVSSGTEWTFDQDMLDYL